MNIVSNRFGKSPDGGTCQIALRNLRTRQLGKFLIGDCLIWRISIFKIETENNCSYTLENIEIIFSHSKNKTCDKDFRKERERVHKKNNNFLARCSILMCNGSVGGKKSSPFNLLDSLPNQTGSAIIMAQTTKNVSKHATI